MVRQQCCVHSTVSLRAAKLNLPVQTPPGPGGSGQSGNARVHRVTLSIKSLFRFYHGDFQTFELMKIVRKVICVQMRVWIRQAARPTRNLLL